MPQLPTTNATLNEIEAARLRTAMQSPEHMKLWLQESGRRYMVLDGFDMVDAIWTGNNPVGVQEFQDVLSLYRHHRRRIPNGRYGEQLEPMSGKMVQVALTKDEALEPEEADRAIRYLVGLVHDPRSPQHIPNWSLENPSL